MDAEELIKQNRQRTNLLFAGVPLRLPASDAYVLRQEKAKETQLSLVPFSLPQAKRVKKPASVAPVPVIDARPERAKDYPQIILPEAVDHPLWQNSTVITGHNAWVTSVAVDPSNLFFATGSLDHTIKFWDLGSYELKVTLTGHIGGVQDLAISKISPYLFSCCDAKQIFCWDLTKNSIVRHFHGHLSGVYCLDLHPKLDIFVSGGRDSVARVWDIRSRKEVYVLEGHDMTVMDVIMQENQPNVITSSADSTIRTWDLRMGKCTAVLTNHQKSVRAIARHPQEWSFASCSVDSIFHWTGQDSRLFKEFKGNSSIINAAAINEDNVFVTACDDGILRFWDWQSGTEFQTTRTIAHSGSIESECGIFDCSFDMTGTRLITCEADKTVKIWKSA